MPPAGTRKRRAAADPQDSPDGDSDLGGNSRRQTQKQPQRQLQRRRPVSDSEDEEDSDVGGDTTLEDGTATQSDGGSREQMVKKLVRLALACEYSRQPIRRADISVKVLGQHGRQFKEVFKAAQVELRSTFGMEMVELPMREKVTISQRRAAQRTDKGPASSKAYALTSVLPEKYRRHEDILTPPKVPTSQTEATYVGLYTFIVSIISLSGGTIPEPKLERYLQRTNAELYTPIDKTDKLLQRLCKEGYLVKIKDASSGDEVVEYMVGPRGKVEIGTNGVAGLVHTVYGDSAIDDLDARIERSLGLQETRSNKHREKRDGVDATQQETDTGSTQQPRRSTRRARRQESESEDERAGDGGRQDSDED
ncbi:MAG: hypothetical protein M1823_004562 [Watsoniomyces obsoletus]|nr:MAG: hypothetical protein M1823_004562 [Watsoniomyces obsoletus]